MGQNNMWKCVLFCIVVTVEAHKLLPQQGEVCKEGSDGQSWICKRRSNCSSLDGDSQQENSVTLCSPGEPEDPLVCCDPKLPRSYTPGDKAKRECLTYGKHEYIEKRNGTHIDNCTFLKNATTNSTLIMKDKVDAGVSEFPHMAFIAYGKNNSKMGQCGGSLISKRFVLTVAHCSEKTLSPPKWVRLGELDVSSSEAQLQKSTDYEIVEIFNSPLYNPYTNENDIALYKLDRDVEYNQNIRPACLQTVYDITQGQAIFSGWGALRGSSFNTSKKLRKVYLDIVANEECNDKYVNLQKSRAYNITSDMICAGDGVRDTCHGDSGGPLQIINDEPFCTYTIVGVTSFGYECGEGLPGVFARVSPHIEWIESIVWP